MKTKKKVVVLCTDWRTDMREHPGQPFTGLKPCRGPACPRWVGGRCVWTVPWGEQPPEDTVYVLENGEEVTLLQ